MSKNVWHDSCASHAHEVMRPFIRNGRDVWYGEASKAFNIVHSFTTNHHLDTENAYNAMRVRVASRNLWYDEIFKIGRKRLFVGCKHAAMRLKRCAPHNHNEHDLLSHWFILFTLLFTLARLIFHYVRFNFRRPYRCHIIISSRTDSNDSLYHFASATICLYVGSLAMCIYARWRLTELLTTHSTHHLWVVKCVVQFWATQNDLQVETMELPFHLFSAASTTTTTHRICSGKNVYCIESIPGNGYFVQKHYEVCSIVLFLYFSCISYSIGSGISWGHFHTMQRKMISVECHNN